MDTSSQPRLFSFFRIVSQDMGYSLRQLRKSPAFAMVAISSLALGIGASVAIFSVVRAVLLDPFPYKDADRMVHVELTQKNSDRYDYLMVTTTELLDLKRVPAVDDVFLMNNRMQALTGDALPVSVRAGFYSTNVFTYMGVPPLMGREFTPADVSNGNANPVAVLSYLFWKRQFGGRQDILNRRIELNHVPYTVIGVASPRFTWGDSDVYIPSLFNADPHVYESAFVKLKRGASYAAASQALQGLVDSFAKQDPANYPQHSRVRIEALSEEAMHGFKTPLLVLFGAVLLLLLIGCANVSILLLARGAARQQEFAVRASIGASRGRIARQLLAESMMLSLLGAAAGVVLAFGGVTLLAAHMPPYSFPHEAAIHVNGTVLLFAVAIGLLTGIVFGSSPAWKLSRAEMGALIQGSSTRFAGRSHDRYLHRMLIGGQVVLTMLLLAGAGAAMRAFLHLVQTPMGFDPGHLFYTVVSVPRGGNHTWQYLLAQQESYRQAIEAAPGVTSVSLSPTWLPPFGGYRGKILVSGNPNLTDAQALLALVSNNTFSTLHVPLWRGRFFTRAEEHVAGRVALVNRAFVRQYLPGEDPLGQSVRSPALVIQSPELVSTANPDGWLQIVGVVDDVRNDGLERPVLPQVFLPASFVVAPSSTFIVRSQGSTAAAMRAVGASLHQLNPELYTLDQHEISWLLETQAWGRESFIASLFALFATLALALSAAGIYSVVSYTVSQRTREFGVRMALGASRSGVVRLVLQSLLATVALGAGAGLGLSLGLNTFLATSAQATVRNPATLLIAAGVLLSVALLASLLPAWKAASIDPMKAIRTE